MHITLHNLIACNHKTGTKHSKQVFNEENDYIRTVHVKPRHFAKSMFWTVFFQNTAQDKTFREIIIMIFISQKYITDAQIKIE